jgi:hypothetical protein
MANFGDLVRPTETLDWVGPKPERTTGLQGAHLIGGAVLGVTVQVGKQLLVHVAVVFDSEVEST